MARYTDDSRERVRDAVDFVDLVGSRVELRRAGVRRYTGLCPFHEERSPSFGIDPVEKLYHCFGCGVGGDVFKWVMETEGMPFAEALELLADRYNVPLERTDPEDPRAAERRQQRDRLHALLERTAAWYVRLLWESPEAAGAREYLASRGLAEPTLREFRVGYSPDAWDRVVAASGRAGYTDADLLGTGLASRSSNGRLVDRFRGRLMFPWADLRGRVIGFGARALSAEERAKYLNSPESDVFHKGRHVYGADLARREAAKADAVVLVEGYTDVLALHQAGIRNVVGQMGTALTADQAGVLRNLAGTLVLCLDQDEAGRQAMLKAQPILHRAGLGAVRVAAMPDGMDPADAVQREGAEAVRARLERAVPFAKWRVQHALANRDTTGASGQDALLAELSAVIRPLPMGLLREELVRDVSGALGLSEGLAAAALGDGGTAAVALTRPRPGNGNGHHAPVRERRGGHRSEQRASRPAAPAGDGGLAALLAADPGREGDPSPPDGPPPDLGTSEPGPAQRALGYRSEAELAFLAYCLALPALGGDRLAALDLERTFTSPVARRAAAHLREHLEHPSSGLPPDDDALGAVMAELVVRAGGLEDVAPSELERAAAMLELARLDRDIAAARAAEEPVSELAAERQLVRAELRRLTH